MASHPIKKAVAQSRKMSKVRKGSSSGMQRPKSPAMGGGYSMSMSKSMC
jgi:hypothetical protein